VVLADVPVFGKKEEEEDGEEGKRNKGKRNKGRRRW
jgi:hypothetical protein